MIKQTVVWDIISCSTKQTEGFGRFLAGQLLPDDVVSLDGDLGAGKTALTRGIAAGLGITDQIVSPTFTILIEHPPAKDNPALYHFDAYRLADAESFFDGGFDEYLSMGGISVVEWGNLIAEALPTQTLHITMRQPDPCSPELRSLHLSWPGCPQRLRTMISLYQKQQDISKGMEGAANENTGC